MMDLVRSLFFVYAKNNIVCTSTDINTLENSTADALSRENMEAFFLLNGTLSSQCNDTTCFY